MFGWLTRKPKSDDYMRGYKKGLLAGTRIKARLENPNNGSKKFRWTDAEALDIWRMFTSGKASEEQLAAKYAVNLEKIRRITELGRYSHVLENI